MSRYVKQNLYILLFLFTILSCQSNAIEKNEKIKLFYKYDKMFFYSVIHDKLDMETGYRYEIFNINELSKNYISLAEECIEVLNEFINKNFNQFKVFYTAATDSSINENEALEIYNRTQKLIRNELLYSLPDAIRCTLVVKDVEYIEVAITIDNDFSARNTNPQYANSVYWSPYITGWQPTMISRTEVIDDQGVIKYHEWFYESNLKLRVVKQIRDKDGKYYGEIYADYYKLDEYDNLFDKDGNPKHPKEDAK